MSRHRYGHWCSLGTELCLYTEPCLCPSPHRARTSATSLSGPNFGHWYAEEIRGPRRARTSATLLSGPNIGHWHAVPRFEELCLYSEPCLYTELCLYTEPCLHTELCLHTEPCLYTELCLYTEPCLYTALCSIRCLEHF